MENCAVAGFRNPPLALVAFGKTFKTRLLSLNSGPRGAEQASGAEFTVDILRRERKIRAVRFPAQSKKLFPGSCAGREFALGMKETCEEKL